MTVDYIHSTTTLNLSARLLYYILSSKSVEFYCGLGVGTSFIRDHVTTYLNQSSVTNSSPLTGEGLIGIRYGDPICVHIELGLGTAPYFEEFGFSYKF